MNEYDTYLKLNLSRFMGEWVAIVGNKVIAHSKNPKVAYKEAIKKSNGQTPMLAKIPKKALSIL